MIPAPVAVARNIKNVAAHKGPPFAGVSIMMTSVVYYEL